MVARRREEDGLIKRINVNAFPMLVSQTTTISNVILLTDGVMLTVKIGSYQCTAEYNKCKSQMLQVCTFKNMLCVFS